MIDRGRQRILELMKVPPAPQAPDGSPGSLVVFRAGRNFYRWQVAIWLLSNIGVLLGTGAGYVSLVRIMEKVPQFWQMAWHLLEAAGLAAFAVGIPFTFMALRLNYEMRWYMVTDRSLRIRRGVWTVEELTMTFANIQEIRVTAGPLQNWLGLADLEVHAAGGGGGDDDHGMGKRSHAAAFEGVDNANEIRDLIVERLRQYRDSGLGESAPAAAAATAESAAASMLDEARALRRLFTPDAGE